MKIRWSSSLSGLPFFFHGVKSGLWLLFLLPLLSNPFFSDVPLSSREKKTFEIAVRVVQQKILYVRYRKCLLFFSLYRQNQTLLFFDNLKEDDKKGFFLSSSFTAAGESWLTKNGYYLQNDVFFCYRQSTKPSLQQAVPRSYGRYGGGLPILGR